MKILLYEHVSGGGYIGEELPEWGAIEGYAMLKALTEDFKALGFQILTLLDSRLKGQTLKADRVELVGSRSNWEASFRRLLKEADAALIVAPEVDGALAKLVGEAWQLCPLTLNCPPSFFENFPSKIEVYEALRRKGVNVPETLVLEVDEARRDIDHLSDKLGFPMVIKPPNGAGCLGVNLIENKEQLKQALEHWVKIGAEDSKLIFQEFIGGVHASLSLIASNLHVRLSTLNLQILKLNSPPLSSQYMGGITPLAKRVPKEIMVEAIKVLKALRLGLKGYVGVDLVLAGKPYIVEVNPRLTTSYLGVRRTFKQNLAAEILNSFLDESPSAKSISPAGYAAYLKTIKPKRGLDSADFYSLNECPGMLTVYASSIKDLLLRIGGLVEPDVQKLIGEEVSRFRRWRSKR